MSRERGRGDQMERQSEPVERKSVPAGKQRLTTTDWVKIGLTAGPYFIILSIGMIFRPDGEAFSIGENINMGLLPVIFILSAYYLLLSALSSFGTVILFFTELLQSLKTVGKRWYIKIPVLFIAYAAITAAGAVVDMFVSSDMQNEQIVRDMASSMPFIVSFLYLAVYTPIVEELIFRHILIGKLSRNWNVYMMSAVSCFIFAAAHSFRPVDLIIYLPMSIGFTAVYLLSGRQVGYSLLLHILNNSMALMLPLV